MILYQHHLPSEVRIYNFTGKPTLANAEVIVIDTVTADAEPVYCRSYLFLQRWLQVFMTMDENLSLKRDDGEFPFVFNCDITTPHYLEKDRAFTTDLFVDILVKADGQGYLIKDVDEFEKMHNERHFGDAWYQHAKDEIATLISLTDSGSFIRFLHYLCPFPKHRTTMHATPMRRREISEIEFMYHPVYPRYR